MEGSLPFAGDVLLELRGVYKSFGSKDILAGASMQIRRGEAVGIIGAPHGAWPLLAALCPHAMELSPDS